MPQEEKRDGLRIGGWIPPYRDGEPPALPVRPEPRTAKRGSLPSLLWSWARTAPSRRHPAASEPPSWIETSPPGRHELPSGPPRPTPRTDDQEDASRGPGADFAWAARERPNTLAWAIRDRLAPLTDAVLDWCSSLVAVVRDWLHALAVLIGGWLRRGGAKVRPLLPAVVANAFPPPRPVTPGGASPHRRVPLPLGAPPATWAAPSRGPGQRRQPFLGEESERRRPILAGALFVLVVAVIAGFVFALSGDSEPPGTTAERVPLPVLPAPSAPVSILPAPVTSAPAVTSVSARHTSLTPSRRPSPSRTRTTTTTAAPPPPASRLVVGATVGLAPGGRPGFLVRHRDFVARIERIGPGSGSDDRADSSFQVRAGLGRSACLSFEAVNFPGYFLRHRNFVLRLDPADRSALFAQDATFCPAPPTGSSTVTLESINYPGRFLVARDGGVHLDPTSPNGATTFTAQSPL